MATTNKGLNLPAAGSTGWNVPLNANTDILDKAFGSFTTVSSTGGVTNLTSDQVQNMCIKSTTSAFLANVTYRIPSGIAGQWVIQNQSAASAYTLTVSSAGGGTSAVVGVGTVRSIYSDGTNVVYADTPSTGDFVNASVSGTLTLGGGDLTGVASQAEAEAGTDNVKVMTPLRVSEAVAAQVSSGYDYQVFTVTGTWTKPVGASANAVVRIQMWAGGAGGGKGSSTNTMASGGGGGGFVQFELPVASLGATESVTVGAGGAGGGTGNSGGTGGTSTFAGISIYGGQGGKSGGSSGNRGGVSGGSWIAAGSAASGSGQGYVEDGGAEISPDQFGGGAGSNTGGFSTVGAFWGGGGGKSSGGDGVTTSKFGGAGGAAATAGTSPGGGGGGRVYANNSTTGGAGARGEVRIYTTW